MYQDSLVPTVAAGKAAHALGGRHKGTAYFLAHALREADRHLHQAGARGAHGLMNTQHEATAVRGEAMAEV